MADMATTRCTAVQPCEATNTVVANPCCGRRRERSRACSAASTWSATTTAVVLQLLLQLLVLSLSGAEAAGLWGLGSGRAGQQQQRGFSQQSAGPDDDDMDEVFAKLQQDQFWAEVEHTGMEVLEDEVADKKTNKVFVEVAKACSIGAQMTLIMGGGALLFRLLPVLLGHELEDEEEVDAASPYLLQSDDASGRSQQALPAAAAGAGGRRQRLLTGGREEQPNNEDAAVRLEDNGEGGGGSGAAEVLLKTAAVEEEEEEEEERGGVVVAKADGRGAAVVATGDGEGGGEEEVRDGDVVVDTPTRAALRKARRLSRPFLKAVAPPLVLLLVARLTLGGMLAKRIDPTLELLFGDDIIDLYSVNRKVVDEVDMPFPKDDDDVPGRQKMKGKRVQRLPRPEGEEENDEGDGL